MPNLLTGALPTPRHLLAAAMPHELLGVAPEHLLILPRKLSNWLNTTYGCCVTTEEAFNKACSGIFITDQVVGQWAAQHGVLNGAQIDQVVRWMGRSGFPQDQNLYNDGQPASVDWTDSASLQNAIASGYIAGGKPSPVKIGVAASQLKGVKGIGENNGWLASGFRRDMALDHCISLCGYGSVGWLLQQLNVPLPANVDASRPGLAAFTWGGVGVIERDSLLNITGEAWVRTPSTNIVGSGTPTADDVLIIGPSVPAPDPGPLPTPTPGPGPSPSPQPLPPLPPQWQDFVQWVLNFLKQNGSVVIPIVEGFISRLPLPQVVILALDAIIERYFKRPVGRRPLMAFPFPKDWSVFLAWVKQELETWGPYAVPPLEAWIATLPLPPAVAASIDALIESILGKKATLKYTIAN